MIVVIYTGLKWSQAQKSANQHDIKWGKGACDARVLV